MDADLRAAARDLCRFAGRYLVGDSDVQPQDVQVAIHDVHAALAAPAVTETADLRADREALWERFTGGEKLAYGCGYRDGRAAARPAPAVTETDLRAALTEAEWSAVVDVYGSFGSRLVADRLEAALATTPAEPPSEGDDDGR